MNPLHQVVKLKTLYPNQKLCSQDQSSSLTTSGANLVKLSSTSTDVITGWISFKGFHLLPSFQSAITNLILELNNKETRVTATMRPLPEVQDEGEEFRVTEDLFGFVITYIFAGAFIYAVFTQVCNSKYRLNL